MHPRITAVLENIKEEINAEYGFHDGIPRINYGPCGVFAKVFWDCWNGLFETKVHIAFVMTAARDECDHVCICFPTGELYDGGVGLHSRADYSGEFVIDEMLVYDESLLDKWSYGLDRTYPRFCPRFRRSFVEKTVQANLETLLSQDVPCDR